MSILRRVLSRKVSVAAMIEFALWLAIPYLLIGLVWAFFDAEQVQLFDTAFRIWRKKGVVTRAQLLELGLHPRGVAVEYNGEILKRVAYADTRLAAGDRVEIVRFVQGGGGEDRLSFEGRATIVPGGSGPLAQLVEQQTLNLRVRGSIPWRLTNGSSTQRPQLPNSESVGPVAGAARGVWRRADLDRCESGGTGIRARLRI